MKCPICGKEIANGSMFCVYCGVQIKKSRKPLFITLFIVIVLLALGGFGYYQYDKAKQEREAMEREMAEAQQQLHQAQQKQQENNNKMLNDKESYLVLVKDGDALLADKNYSESISKYNDSLVYEQKYSGTGSASHFNSNVKAQLEFWETYNFTELYEYFDEANRRLAEINKANEALTEEIKEENNDDEPALLANDTLKAQEESLKEMRANFPIYNYLTPSYYQNEAGQTFPAQTARVGMALVKDTANINRMLKQVKNVFPRNVRFAWCVKPNTMGEGVEYIDLVALKTSRDNKAALGGEVIVDARQDYDQNGRVEVTIQMNSEGAKAWKRLTGENIGRQVAIVLDNYVYSYPVVTDEIPSGRSSISGGDMSVEEAQDLANILKAGKLPAKISSAKQQQESDEPAKKDKGSSEKVECTYSVKTVHNDTSETTTYVESASGVAQGDHEYVDLGLSVKWATCNVGATTPEGYGDYFAWGETSTKTEYTEDNSKTCGSSMGDISGNSSYDAARANWGGTWRLPTKAELEELENKCTWTWTTHNGVKGYKVTGPNGNSIFLPAAGIRTMSGLLADGNYGYYWSSAPAKSSVYSAYDLFFYRDGNIVSYYDRDSGQSVRPVLE